MKILIKKSRNGQFYLLMIAKNGEPIFKSSETYHNKKDAMKTIGYFVPMEVIDTTVTPNKVL
jgi:uncharacterized protein YegP (UPF0339 family)